MQKIFQILGITLIVTLLSACGLAHHTWQLTDKTWGNPGDFLNEMTGDTQSLSDAEIKTLLENDFLWNPNGGASRPQVQVQQGIVTFSGNLQNKSAQSAMIHSAEALNSVQGIQNHTRVLPIGTRFDSRLSRDAQLALALNSHLVGNNIDVFVQNGIVYLTGKVKDKSQKELAAQIVALGRGSFAIRNHIQIAEQS